MNNNSEEKQNQFDNETNKIWETLLESIRKRAAVQEAEFEETLPIIGNPPLFRPCRVHSDCPVQLNKAATVKKQDAVYETKCSKCDYEERVLGPSYRRWVGRGLPKNCFGVKLDGLDLNPSERAVFDDFLKSKSGFLVLLGTMGGGKTIAACALLQHFGRGHYITRGDLISKFRRAYAAGRGKETTDEVATKYNQSPLLVLDEFEKADDGRDASNLLFRIIDTRYREMLPTIICGNATLEHFKQIVGEYAYSRISGAGSSLIEFEGVDRRKTKEASEFYKSQVALTRRLDQLDSLEDS